LRLNFGVEFLTYSFLELGILSSLDWQKFIDSTKHHHPNSRGNNPPKKDILNKLDLMDMKFAVVSKECLILTS